MGHMVATGNHSTGVTQFHKTTLRLLNGQVMPEVFSRTIRKKSSVEKYRDKRERKKKDRKREAKK